MRILVLHQYFLDKGDSGGSRFNELTKIWKDAGNDITVIAGMVHYSTGKKKEKYRGKFILKEINEDGVEVDDKCDEGHFADQRTLVLRHRFVVLEVYYVFYQDCVDLYEDLRRDGDENGWNLLDHGLRVARLVEVGLEHEEQENDLSEHGHVS